MIGSKRKIRTIFDSLEKEGFSRERLDAVYTPIGLDIGAKTPEEIALSITAELVRVRAGRQRHGSR
jgi:xanthine dehydrogenase accessory factor